MTTPFRAIYKETADYVFTTGDNHTLAEQCAFNNTALVEYYVDMTLDLKRFENIWATQLNLVPSLCLYMHTHEGEIVGLSRTAVRGTRAWLAGIGLVPKFRGQRVGPLLFTEYLELLKMQSAVQRLQFECIAQNERALKLYTNFGCVVDGALLTFHVEFERPDEQAGQLEIVSDGEGIDLRRPWLQHTTAYSWQREFNVLLSGVHRQFVFRRWGDSNKELAFAVEVLRDPPRINGIAYHKRPTEDVFQACLSRLAAKLGVREIVIQNEPDSSDVVVLLDKVGRRDELSQVHLTRVIERG